MKRYLTELVRDVAWMLPVFSAMTALLYFCYTHPLS